ncbi:replication associated protein [Sparassis crispa]|uniref:Replication associated protein n=1 Tax=Sparassis crispa TaxID=139825 RepID=A0A401H2K0_9APHY|nr:replication associated protein [Sparassis crispa]GBE88657.1 replication associated protein [Sparassis crispa]
MPPKCRRGNNGHAWPHAGRRSTGSNGDEPAEGSGRAPYKLQSPKVLVMWPKAEQFDEEKVIELMRGLGEGIRLKIAHKDHADGTPHYHAYIEFQSQPSIRDAQNRLTVNGNKPSFQPVVRTPEKVWKYVGDSDKASTFVVQDYFPPGHFRPPPRQEVRSVATELAEAVEDGSHEQALEALKNKANHNYTHIRDMSTTSDEFMKYMLQHATSDYFKNFVNINTASKNAFKPPEVPYERPLGLVIDLEHYPEISDWVENELKPRLGKGSQGSRGKSLCLYGESRTGKTLFFRSLPGNHIYMHHLFNSTEFLSKPEADFAIFDDFRSLEYLPSFKCWYRQQHRFTITDKYKPKEMVTWGRPAICLENDDPRNGPKLTPGDIDSLNMNMIFVEVTGEHKLAWVDSEQVDLAKATAEQEALRATEEVAMVPLEGFSPPWSLADDSQSEDELFVANTEWESTLWGPEPVHEEPNFPEDDSSPLSSLDTESPPAPEAPMVVPRGIKRKRGSNPFVDDEAGVSGDEDEQEDDEDEDGHLEGFVVPDHVF